MVTNVASVIPRRLRKEHRPQGDQEHQVLLVGPQTGRGYCFKNTGSDSCTRENCPFKYEATATPAAKAALRRRRLQSRGPNRQLPRAEQWLLLFGSCPRTWQMTSENALLSTVMPTQIVRLTEHLGRCCRPILTKVPTSRSPRTSSSNHPSPGSPYSDRNCEVIKVNIKAVVGDESRAIDIEQGQIESASYERRA